MIEYTIYNCSMNITFYVIIEASTERDARYKLFNIISAEHNSVKSYEWIA